MSKNPIPQSEVDSLLAQVKTEMTAAKFPEDIVVKTRVKVIHPDYWEVSLFVPCATSEGAVRAAPLRRNVQGILFNRCNVDSETCMFFGKHHSATEYAWYFRHPRIPQEVNDLIEAEIEAQRDGEIGMGLPVPSSGKSSSDTAFLTLKDEFFRKIESGAKTVEYRNLNQYYCDKFFPAGKMKKFVKLNRGYLPGAENRMVFEIADIVLVSEDGRECPAVGEDGKHVTSFSQIPKRFAPAAYGIKLGKRIT